MENFIKSKYAIEIIKNENETIVYNSLFGNARILDKGSASILHFFETEHNMRELIVEMGITKEELPIVEEIFEDFIYAKLLVHSETDERLLLEKDNEQYIREKNKGFPFEFIGFSVTKKCNFACKYCIAGANVKRQDADFAPEILYDYISRFAEELLEHNKNKLNIGFTGGEPLTYWIKLKPVIEQIYINYSDKLIIEISMNTNLSLMTDEIADDFAKYNILPYTSIDGVEIVSNRVRVYKDGQKPYNDILRGIETVRKHGIECNSFYLTLTRDNFDFDVDELISFISENSFNSVTIEPDLINVVDIDMNSLCDKLMECYEKAKDKGIDINGFWKRPFNNMFDYNDSSNGFCRALDFKSIVIDKDGYISPCGYSDTKISKLQKYEDIVKDESYQNYICRNLRGEIEECKGCELEGMCKGGCLISRENTLDCMVFQYRCGIYKNMTRNLLLSAKFE